MGTRSRLIAVLVTAGTALALVAPASAAPQPDSSRTVYQVLGADTAAERTTVVRTGVDPMSTQDSSMSVTANDRQAAELRAAGFSLRPIAELGGAQSTAPRDAASVSEFPPGDEAYHTYDEVTGELRKTVADHPDLASLSSAGKSFEGRNLNLLKISDNAARDENEPEVLITCNQHAREHLTTEMCLRVAARYTDDYANDPAVKELVDSSEIYLVPNVNPDGAEYDIAGGEYQGWRKNRQPNEDGSTGTDLNRNWDYQWGCCGGSSAMPEDETYRGAAAFSAPETKAIADFVDSRVVGGEQQIKAAVDMHTFGELVMWPFGFTAERATEGMTEAEYRRHADLGEKMAASNGYTPQQSSQLYVNDGGISDWTWGKHKILSFAFEMYPASGGGLEGFYPPGNVIERETARNDEAVDLLVRAAGGGQAG